ncbi:hypothetical protein HGRIS_002385 [Hohenbuehelia grisea]|uniref:DUF6699 domain-containing protein n=1 Tax=Hohenbuehelia grisea TaxID=104357 RepID=A0ABR3JKT3_9AGAR
MPGKHVHFEFPATPSPTYSSSSLPSSYGPMTPPPISQFGSSASYKSTIPLPAVPTQVHPALGFSSAPLLNWDTSCLPTTASPYHSSLSPTILGESAFNPCLPYVTIISAYLPWKITVKPTSGKYVRVMDVLDAIYRGLRLNVSGPEFEALPSMEAKKRVNAAYHRRCARIADAAARSVEQGKGVKRIDFLAEHNKFMGLSSTPYGPQTWTLNVS